MNRGVIHYPHYIGDYQSHTMHLTTLQHGAYRLLMDHYYATGKPLDANASSLASICRLNLSEFVIHKDVLKSFFRQVRGKWHHDRIEEELNKIRLKSSSAKKSASVRWQSERIQNASKTHMPSVCSLESESLKDKRLIGSGRKASYNGRLSKGQLDIAGRFEKALGGQWEKDLLKWMKRCRHHEAKAERVVSEVESAIRESRINSTPAQYAEQIWKEFK